IICCRLLLFMDFSHIVLITLSLHDALPIFFGRNLIQMEALNFIRGRSIVKTYLIIDEAQNMTPNQVKGIITRAGKDTKIILLGRSEEHTSELQSRFDLVCRLLLEKKKK